MLNIESDTTVKIETQDMNPDVMDINRIVELIRYVKKNGAPLSWASVASSNSYAELHGLANLVEHEGMNWVIFKCEDETYCLYVGGGKSKPVARKKAFAEEAHWLSEIIADKVISNGFKVQAKAAKSDAWLKACEKLLEDKPFEEIKQVLLWATADHFWMQNIRSAPTFYKHYDRLAIAATNPLKPMPKPPVKSSGRASAVDTGLEKFLSSRKTEEDPF